MAGTKAGGMKARATTIKKHGKDFYKRIGHLGGIAPCRFPKGFANDPERAKLAGQKGGKISKRGKAKKHENKQEDTNN